MDNQTTEQVAQSDPAVETVTDQSQNSVLATETQTSDQSFQDLIPDSHSHKLPLQPQMHNPFLETQEVCHIRYLYDQYLYDPRDLQCQ